MVNARVEAKLCIVMVCQCTVLAPNPSTNVQHFAPTSYLPISGSVTTWRVYLMHGVTNYSGMTTLMLSRVGAAFSNSSAMVVT